MKKALLTLLILFSIIFSGQSQEQKEIKFTTVTSTHTFFGVKKHSQIINISSDEDCKNRWVIMAKTKRRGLRFRGKVKLKKVEISVYLNGVKQGIEAIEIDVNDDDIAKTMTIKLSSANSSVSTKTFTTSFKIKKSEDITITFKTGVHKLKYSPCTSHICTVRPVF